MHICRYSHDDDTLPEALRSALEERAFAYFYGAPETGASDSTSVRDSASAPRLPRAQAGEQRESLLRSVDAVLAEAPERLNRLTRHDEDLAEAAAHRSVAWVSEVWNASLAAASVQEEQELLEALRGPRGDDTARHGEPELLDRALGLLEKHYPERRGSWRYLAGEIVRGELKGAADFARADALESLLHSWEIHFRLRRRQVEQDILRRGLQGFLARLERDMREGKEQQRRIRDLLGIAGGFWDLLNGAWQRADWSALEAAASFLEEQPTIRQLADILGRGLHAEPEYVPVSEERRIEERQVYDEVLGRSEVEGIRRGHSVETMLPSEAALLSDEDTELVFAKRYADDDLLSLNYRRLDTHLRVTARSETLERLLPQERGPLILVIDTSGSMKGRPEQVAKAAGLAIARSSLREGRACYLISFSTDIRTLELRELPRDLPALADFLAHSFHGGTDLRPPLREALRLLETRRFRRADVLTVSDFQLPKIADRLGAELQRARDRFNTLFHSLTVNERAVEDPLNLFDFRWHYDISHPESEGVLISRRYLTRG